MPTRRVVSLLYDQGTVGLAALYRRTGLAPAAYPAFRAVVETLRECDLDGTREGRACFAQQMIERVLTRHQMFSAGETDEFITLFGRLSAEAAREEVRAETGGYFLAA